MAERYGLLTATLADGIEQERLQELAALINERIHPPEPVTANDIFVRGMYVVSDEVNSFGGRFPATEFQSLKEKLINTPVLVGHRKDSLPIGRTFHAELVERNGRPWVKSLFYWLKSGDGSQMLADNIDGGIYQECSIGFVYRTPECSVCGEDIRQCEHQVFSSYSNEGKNELCHFLYREIEKVLETSLVYRGANPDTGMSRELAEGEFGSDVDRGLGTEAQGTGDDGRLLVIPCYDAVTLQISKTETEFSVHRVDGKPFSAQFANCIHESFPKAISSCVVQLVGYRGKERCSLVDTERYLAGKSSPLTRIELKVMPDKQGKIPECKTEGLNNRITVRPIRCRIVSKEELALTSQAIGTKTGVTIWPLAAYEPTQPGQRYTPQMQRLARNQWSVQTDDSDTNAVLLFNDGVVSRQYRIERFDKRLWNAGRCFFADSAIVDSKSTQATPTTPRIAVRARPVLLHGRRRFLLSKQSIERKQVAV